MNRLSKLKSVAGAGCLILLIQAEFLQAEGWPLVSGVNFGGFSEADLADHELEVPYYLFHFAQVANAVVEHGDLRGYLDIKVNRNPADNEPYNARVMEMQMALAYFYAVDRPWNPYQGDPAVRVRLEAMLDRWTRIQHPDGRFAEYSPDNWSLAPTAFGAMAAAQAIELIVHSGQPFDAGVFESARVSLRLALMAIFTRTDLRVHGRQWSNQYSPAYSAALAYLRLWPDDQLDEAFVAAFFAAHAEDQSPAGYFYEQGGPDFGYSSVHERNMAVALPSLRERPALLAVAIESERSWARWLAANHVPSPSADRWFVNAGLNTRTRHAATFRGGRPFAEWVEEMRPFALTDVERAGMVAARRQALRQGWGSFASLTVPSSDGYRPSFVYDAVRPLDVWQPTAAQRAEAESFSPGIDADTPRFNRQFRDEGTWPLTVTTIRRPDYQAWFNSERLRLVGRQGFGLGLVWHPDFGPFMQAVADTRWKWGTRSAEAQATFEETHLLDFARTVGGALLDGGGPGPGDLPQGDLEVSYRLSDRGKKTVRFFEDRIEVEVEHAGNFTELIPLMYANDVEWSVAANVVRLTRPQGAYASVVVQTSGAQLSMGDPVAAHGLLRRELRISARDRLGYTLYLRRGPETVEPTGEVVLAGESFQPANGWVDAGETVLLRLEVRNLGTESLGAVMGEVLPREGVIPLVSGAREMGFLVAGGEVARAYAVRLDGVPGEIRELVLRLWATEAGQSWDLKYPIILGGGLGQPEPPERLKVTNVLASSYQDPNVPEHVVDGLLDAEVSRWSALGEGVWIELGWPEPERVDALDMVVFRGDERRTRFRVETWTTTGWKEVFDGESSGLTNEWERVRLSPTVTTRVRIIGYGHVRNDGSPGTLWNSFAELRPVALTRAGYHGFMDSYFGDYAAPEDGTAGPLDDPDGDGVVNWMEYALGRDPLDSSSEMPLELVKADGQIVIGFNRARNDVVYRIETSFDLVSWETYVTNPGKVGERVHVIVENAVSAPPRMFYRLRVEDVGRE